MLPGHNELMGTFHLKSKYDGDASVQIFVCRWPQNFVIGTNTFVDAAWSQLCGNVMF